MTAAGLATAAELDATLAELEAFAADPRTIVSLPRIVQAWGRRPRAGAEGVSSP